MSSIKSNLATTIPKLFILKALISAILAKLTSLTVDNLVSDLVYYGYIIR